MRQSGRVNINKKKTKMKNWELSFGFYPGICLGFRTYKEKKKNNHVLYIPFFDACLTVAND